MSGRIGYNNVVTDGLTLYLDAGNRTSYPGSGTTWRDLTLYKYNATLINGTAFNSIGGGNMTFDGTDDYVASYPLNSIFTNSFSIGFFYKTANADAGGYSSIMVGMYVAPDGDWWIGVLGGKLIFSFGSPSKQNLESSMTVSDNTWRYTTCIYDKSINTIYMYNNGILDASNNTIPANILQANGMMAIGRFGEFGIARHYYIGSIAEIKVYSRALSSTEVSQNYNALKSRFRL